jgi:predicted membrane-bound spermidine synthase
MSNLTLVLLTLVFLSLALVTIWFLAHQLGDPHFLNRGGAALAALGALLVVVQVLAELRLERGREQDNEAEAVADLTPANREVAQRIVRARTSERWRMRMSMVISIALIVFVGEVMHGWGDYFYGEVVSHAPQQENTSHTPPS